MTRRMFPIFALLFSTIGLAFWLYGAREPDVADDPPLFV